MLEEMINKRSQRDEKTKIILKERAKKLAETQSKVHCAEKTIGVLQFTLAKGVYAIESEFVREVYPLKDLTALPATPAHIIGLINVRRRVTTVIDLQILFKLPPQTVTIGKPVIILKKEEVEFAILIDELIGAGPIHLNTIEFSLPNLTEQGDVFLKGITKDGVALLDANKLIGNPKIIVKDSIEL